MGEPHYALFGLQWISVVFAGTRSALARLKHHSFFPVPDIFGKSALPRPGPTSANACPQPILDAIVIAAQTRGAQGCRRPPVGRRAPRVVRAANVAAVRRGGGDVDTFRRQLQPPGLGIAVVRWPSHGCKNSRLGWPCCGGGVLARRRIRKCNLRRRELVSGHRHTQPHRSTSPPLPRTALCYGSLERGTGDGVEA